MQLPLESGGEGGNVNLQSVTEQTALISALKEEIVEMRGAIGKIDNSMLFPIPFQYFHVVNMVLTVRMSALCACVPVSLCACVCACVCLCTHLRMHIRTYARLCARMCVRGRVRE